MNPELEAFARAISRVLGWAYFLAWCVLCSSSGCFLPRMLTLLFRSLSFYPQPISNYVRKSTLGLAIDFPTLNVLGFTCYTISTASFLYSPTIKAQYAQRHPEAPVTTVRFNDFLFAAHGAVMCFIIYSQFFEPIWGFEVGKRQRVSRVVFTVWWACVAAIFAVVLLVRFKGQNGGYNADGWAWIDVVSWAGLNCVCPLLTTSHLDLHSWLRQTPYRFSQIYTTSMGQLQTQVHRWLEYLSHAAGLCWRLALTRTAMHRLCARKRLERCHWQPSQVRPW